VQINRVMFAKVAIFLALLSVSFALPEPLDARQVCAVTCTNGKCCPDNNVCIIPGGTINGFDTICCNEVTGECMLE